MTRDDYVSGPNPCTGDWLSWATRGEVSLRNPAGVGGSDLRDGHGEILAEYYIYL